MTDAALGACVLGKAVGSKTHVLREVSAGSLGRGQVESGRHDLEMVRRLGLGRRPLSEGNGITMFINCLSGIHCSLFYDSEN